jgi:hypothetical protein
MRRDSKPEQLRLFGVLRLLLLVLVVQLSGVAQAFAHARDGISRAHDCSCCAATAAGKHARRAMHGAEGVLSWSAPEACGGAADGGGCASGCADCQAPRDAKLPSSMERASIAQAARCQRVAARGPERVSISPPHRPSIFRPPCP